ncbi:MAG: hypothetical protein K6B65_06980 [Bacilli bacterium]|nr:hypothetical protein [Bacilli bacterium]
MLKKLFLNKGLRFYLELVAGVIGIVAAIIFFAMDRQLLGGELGFADISHFTLIFIIAGSVVALFDAFFPLPGVGIVAAALFGLGVGNHLRLACYPLADLSLAVPFFTKDVILAQKAVTLFITFLVVFILLAIMVVVSNFLGKKKA